jgi:hypothetical protein
MLFPHAATKTANPNVRTLTPVIDTGGGGEVPTLFWACAAKKRHAANPRRAARIIVARLWDMRRSEKGECRHAVDVRTLQYLFFFDCLIQQAGNTTGSRVLIFS